MLKLNNFARTSFGHIYSNNLAIIIFALEKWIIF